MAKLSEKTMLVGRRLVDDEDREGLRRWIVDNAPTLNVSAAMRGFNLCFKAGDKQRAFKLFNAAFEEYDQDLERRAARIRLAVAALLLLGAFGGVAFLASLLI